MPMRTDILRNPLAHARGLGSARDGTHHWWLQRVTAVANVPLAVWFVYSLMCLAPAGDVRVVAEWFASPWVALASAALFIAIPYHARLGLQVVIEDYVHAPFTRLALLLTVKFLFLGTAAMALLAIIKLHFFGV